ncbi:MAG: hypothetical protein BGO01_20055 [Armatimonadetes bacterium 55-13]|nr:hypothetical protein [Armatimonadota bacterium]OJU64407.1 MAG: hypothetical protein BGO01_20055 [Armatimonadetes bacterium 55-13]
MNPLYEKALNLAENKEPKPSAIAAVAKKTSDEAARWAFTQWTLRQKAAAKFKNASQMLFDREGLEMATHERMAAYNASLFPASAHVFDLTAGIGADLIALAQRGPSTGVEVSPERAELARHNLDANRQTAEILIGDGLERIPASSEYIFADPARREGGRRTLDPSQFAPNPSLIAERFKDAKRVVFKLSPMLPDSFLESLGDDIRFVSFGGECREVLVSFGSEVNPTRKAVQVESGEELEEAGDPIQTETPNEYLYEADPAAIRAHTLGALADPFDLYALGDSNGYLTGPNEISSPWLRAYRVLYHGKADLKETKRELECLHSSTPVVKQRGADQDLEAMRKKLKLTGDRELCVILYTVGKSIRHIIAQPLPAQTR